MKRRLVLAAGLLLLVGMILLATHRTVEFDAVPGPDVILRGERGR